MVNWVRRYFNLDIESDGQFRDPNLNLNNNRFHHKQCHVLFCQQVACGEKSNCNLLLRYANGRVMDLCIITCLSPLIQKSVIHLQRNWWSLVSYQVGRLPRSDQKVLKLTQKTNKPNQWSKSSAIKFMSVWGHYNVSCYIIPVPRRRRLVLKSWKLSLKLCKNKYA